MHHVAQREELYRDFIIAASQAYGIAVVDPEPRIQEAIVLYSMISRMRVLSSSQVIESAEKTVDSIMNADFSAKKTVREVRAMMISGEAADPLKDFSEITREELRQF